MTLNMPPVADQFGALFGVSYSGLAVLFSAYYWTHSLIQVPIGLLIDRIGAGQSLRIFFTATLACSLVPFLAPTSFALALAARLVMGGCSAGYFLASVKVAKLIAPASAATRIQGAQGAAFSIGTMLPYLILPYTGSYGWMASYGIGAAICVVILVASVKLPLRTMRRARNILSFQSIWASVKVIATSPAVWFVGSCHGLALGSMTSVIGNWMPSILVDSAPGTTLDSWALAASLMLFVSTAGRFLGGEAARKMARGTLLNRVMLVVGVAYMVLAFAPSSPFILAAGFALALICGGVYASAITLAIDTAQPGYEATTLGFMNMIGNLISLLLILFLGQVRDLTGAFSLSLAVSGVVALVFWFLSRSFAAKIETR